MKNDELQKVLEDVLRHDEDLTDDTILLLQDASLHAALKRKMPMQSAASTYAVLAAGHEVMVALFGLSQVVGGIAADPALSDLFGSQSQPKARDLEQEKREMELLDALLKDLPPIDLL